MISASEIRKKYFNDDPNADIKNIMDSIEKKIVEYAEKHEEWLIVQVPVKYKDCIKPALEDLDYTVWSSPIGEPKEKLLPGNQFITICWEELEPYQKDEIEEIAYNKGYK